MRSGNSIAASGVTARPVAETGALKARLISGAVLIPPVLASAYVGFPAFEALVAVAGAVLAWEWSRLCGFTAGGAPALMLGGVVVGGVAAAAAGYAGVGAAAVVVGALAVMAATEARTARPLGLDRRLWHSVGALYIGLPCVALIWLRADPALGRSIAFWLFGVVWASDVGAYACGRSLGGPRLAPRISPKKTWSGLVGGIAAAGAAGAGVAAAEGVPSPVSAAALGALTGAVAQGGDLLESWIKRRFGVKDVSNLIPGHGGLLDRVDGLLAGIVAATVVVALGALKL